MTVAMSLKDGRQLEGRADMAKGHPKKPMTRDDVRLKFFDCASLVMDKRSAQELLDRLERIETLKSVSELTPLLAGRLD
jgi:2-methylcitrate dehydratase PrpD